MKFSDTEFCFPFAKPWTDRFAHVNVEQPKKTVLCLHFLLGDSPPIIYSLWLADLLPRQELSSDNLFTRLSLLQAPRYAIHKDNLMTQANWKINIFAFVITSYVKKKNINGNRAWNKQKIHRIHPYWLKMHLLDILSTSPHYFCKKWIGATNENSNVDLRD